MRYTDPSGHACVEGTSYCVNSSTGQTLGSLSSYNDSPTLLSDRLDGEEESGGICSSSICNPNGVGAPPLVYGSPSPTSTPTFTPSPTSTPCTSPTNGCATTIAVQSTQIALFCMTNPCIGQVPLARTPYPTLTPMFFDDVHSEHTQLWIDESKPSILYVPSRRVPIPWGDIFDALNYTGKALPPLFGHPAFRQEVGDILSGESFTNTLLNNTLPFILSRGIGIFILPQDTFYNVNPIING